MAKARAISAIAVLEQDHDYVKKSYRAFQKMDHEDLMHEAEIEHDSAKTLIRQLERMKPSDPKYIAAFNVLCEYIEHHVKEEEDEMFPKVRRARVNLQALGKKLMARRIQLAARK